MEKGISGEREAETTRMAEMAAPERDWGGNIEETGADGCGKTADPSGLLMMIREKFPGKRQDIRSYSPLTLAYMGDAVYDLIIRTAVVERANRPANVLHHIAVRYVSAAAQAKMVSALLGRLTEEESTVYRRGRNAKPHTKAKNVSMEDYLKATGFEAVLGYLYLTGNMERALELVREGVEAVGMEGL